MLEEHTTKEAPMSSQQQPQLSQGNRMYLYRMLKAAIGTGRQTFITQIEDALAADGLAAEDMGFSDARALMEALGDMVTLTVFKGGRIYATLVAQPEWDEALESADDSPKPAGGKSAGKPWKRKKGARGLKPVRPRIVPRETADEPANVETAESVSAGQETPMALSETPATSQEAPARAPEASWPQRGAPMPMPPQPAKPLQMLQEKQPRMTPRSLPRARQAKPMVPSNEDRRCPRKAMGWNRLRRRTIPKRTHLPRQAMRG